MIADTGTSFILGPTVVFESIAAAIGGVMSEYGRYQVFN